MNGKSVLTIDEFDEKPWICRITPNLLPLLGLQISGVQHVRDHFRCNLIVAEVSARSWWKPFSDTDKLRAANITAANFGMLS